MTQATPRRCRRTCGDCPSTLDPPGVLGCRWMVPGGQASVATVTPPPLPASSSAPLPSPSGCGCAALQLQQPRLVHQPSALVPAETRLLPVMAPQVRLREAADE